MLSDKKPHDRQNREHFQRFSDKGGDVMQGKEPVRTPEAVEHKKRWQKSLVRKGPQQHKPPSIGKEIHQQVQTVCGGRKRESAAKRSGRLYSASNQTEQQANHETKGYAVGHVIVISGDIPEQQAGDDIQIRRKRKSHQGRDTLFMTERQRLAGEVRRRNRDCGENMCVGGWHHKVF